MSIPQSFIGRHDELAQLHGLVDDARQGHGGAVAVVADAGVGKSSLVDHLVARCDSDVRVLRLTGVEVESDLAYAGLATLLAQAGSDLSEVDPDSAAVLRGAIGLGEATPAGLEVHIASLSALSAFGARTGVPAPAARRREVASTEPASAWATRRARRRKGSGGVVMARVTARGRRAHRVKTRFGT
jgi:hypothetical protein